MNEEPYVQKPEERVPLAAGASLHRRYTVRRVLGMDRDAVRYDGFDYRARQPVTIEEFFPAQIVYRAAGTDAVSPRDRDSGELFFAGSEAFLHQYGALTQAIGSPNIISVFDAFFENGTAYAVTEPLDGLTLSACLGRRGRSLGGGELVYIVRAVADALLVVHSLNILHHGISEDSIVLCRDGTVKLTCFAAGRVTVERGRAVDDAAVWTDIRALGETLYRAYTGGRMPEAGRGGEGLPGPLAAIFAGMLAENPAERFSSVFDLRYAAYGTDIAPERPALDTGAAGACAGNGQHTVRHSEAPEVQRQPADGAGKRSNLRAVCIIGVILAALIGVLVWVLTR